MKNLLLIICFVCSCTFSTVAFSAVDHEKTIRVEDLYKELKLSAEPSSVPNTKILKEQIMEEFELGEEEFVQFDAQVEEDIAQALEEGRAFAIVPLAALPFLYGAGTLAGLCAGIISYNSIQEMPSAPKKASEIGIAGITGAVMTIGSLGTIAATADVVIGALGVSALPGVLAGAAGGGAILAAGSMLLLPMCASIDLSSSN